MGRETKFGLLVGVVFIVLFGIILAGRAGTSVSEHATMPTGDAQRHLTTVQALHRTVDPFVEEGTLDVKGGAPTEAVQVTQPVEEAFPAPRDAVATKIAETATETRGTVSIGGPVMVETPGNGAPGNLIARMDLPEPKTGDIVVSTSSDTGRQVYTVRAGDTLGTVAKQFYGHDAPKYWKVIYDANKSTLKDPNRLSAGQKLVIPPSPVPAATPKTDTPQQKPADPARDALAVKPADASAKDKAALREALKTMTVPVDPSKPVARDAASSTVRDVTADDLGRMYGGQSDLVEQPTRPAVTYTVQSGDTFYKIAEKLYGDPGKYGRLLYLKNQHLVSGPGKLQIGQRILLLDGVDTKATDTAMAAR